MSARRRPSVPIDLTAYGHPGLWARPVHHPDDLDCPACQTTVLIYARGDGRAVVHLIHDPDCPDLADRDRSSRQ